MLEQGVANCCGFGVGSCGAGVGGDNGAGVGGVGSFGAGVGGSAVGFAMLDFIVAYGKKEEVYKSGELCNHDS